MSTWSPNESLSEGDIVLYLNEDTGVSMLGVCLDEGVSSTAIWGGKVHTVRFYYTSQHDPVFGWGAPMRIHVQWLCPIGNIGSMDLGLSLAHVMEALCEAEQTSSY